MFGGKLREKNLFQGHLKKKTCKHESRGIFLPTPGGQMYSTVVFLL